MTDADFRRSRARWRWIFLLGGLVWLAALITAGPLAGGAIEDSLNLKLVQAGGLVWVGYAGHLWYRAAAYARHYRETEWASRWGSDPIVPIHRRYQPYVNATVIASFGLALLALPLFVGAIG